MAWWLAPPLGAMLGAGFLMSETAAEAEAVFWAGGLAATAVKKMFSKGRPAEMPRRLKQVKRASTDVPDAPLGARVKRSKTGAARTARVPGARKRVRVQRTGVPRRKSAAGTKRGDPAATVQRAALTIGKPRVPNFARLYHTDRILRFQGVNLDDNVPVALPGRFQLLNDNLSATTVRQCPLHVLELNSTIQGSAVATCIYQMNVQETGVVTFPGYGAGPGFGGLANDGVTGVNSWIAEYMSSPAVQLSTTGSQRTRYIQADWIDIHLKMYGAVTQETTFDLFYVQVAQDWADPLRDHTPNVATTDQERRERIDASNMWQAMIRGSITSELGPQVYTQGKSRAKGMKVLARWKYRIPGKLTTAADQSPNSQVVKLRIHDSRVLDYGYTQDSTLGTDGDQDNRIGQPNVWRIVVKDDQGVNISSRPAPLKRRYLLIRATNTTNVAFANITAADTPSYDLVMRKHETLSLR